MITRNLLQLPLDQFNSEEIKVADDACDAFKLESLNLKYNPLSNRVVILDSSRLDSITVKTKLLLIYIQKFHYLYSRQLKLDETRDNNGNLQIFFSGSIASIGDARESPSTPLSSEPSGGASKASTDVLKNEDPTPELSELEERISKSVTEAMKTYFNPASRDMDNGIWYGEEYRKYLKENSEVEMDPSYLSGHAHEEYFLKISRNTFILKEGKNASLALLSFLKGKTICDCVNATIACYYKCILDVLGEEKFNELFSFRPNLLMIGQNELEDTRNPISWLLMYTEGLMEREIGGIGERPLKVGDGCYFKGVTWYGNKHPEGHGQGFNAIYVGNNPEGSQLFMAHGFKEPLTETEIYSELLKLYNEERTPQDIKTISEKNDPPLYDQNLNPFLKQNYTISLEELATDRELFMDGFQVECSKRLNTMALYQLNDLEATDASRLLLELYNRAQAQNRAMYF